MKEIDARGLACPAPVLMTKDAVESGAGGPVRVIVDNGGSRENVTLFLESRGYRVSVEEKGGDFYVSGDGGPDAGEAPAEAERLDEDLKKILVMVTTDRMGHGDDELGLKLMQSFIKTLKEMGGELWRLVLVNNGVKLAVTGADALADLQSLADAGVTILVCGTCLTHFNLLDEKRIGETTNMLDIVTAMQLADKVVNI